ncbi:MAG: hypothetical protein J6C44_10760 [Muribaculaceae bacterium]|nr:hypothetical protein [Muribaculaceae bacterium]
MTDRLHIGNRYLSHVGLNWHDNTARMHDPLLMRFTSPDPLASKYPALSPWAHTAVNPVNAIDPSGRDIIKLHNDGHMTIISPSGGCDIVFSDNNDFIVLKKGTIKNGVSGVYNFRTEENLTGSKNYTYYDIKGIGFSEFSFFAQHTDVEWDRMQLNDGTSIIGTSNDYGSVASGTAFFNNNPQVRDKITGYDHTHPTDEKQSRPDVKLAKWIESFSPNTKFRIFIAPEFQIIYNFDGKSEPVKVYEDGEEVNLDGFVVYPK